ncbi:hypothetical protein [Aureibacter tunicatorum]|uniref:Uncharacterized protein n=1 Tax=Aureibacter tunicatorum TaxID=866807 RepID=A0AAE3XNB9_9BACT|nr:hypothetical protein [Aureibacter tunicatorum]MDR6241086.1 hypothetical protein [Aureibacter tunicatorum]BDD03864.1 hypothetical protein AUTU_13470 [Aureibacter tunicatorum]
MEKTFIGHKAKLLNPEKEGIILQMNYLNSEKMVPTYNVSLDRDIKIVKTTEDSLSFGEKVPIEMYFNRIIRDIQSEEVLTREYAAETLCNFLEFELKTIDLNLLKSGIQKIIEQIKVENNINTEQKLVEGLFEFIWHKKISKKAEIELLEKLTEIDKYYIWSYLGDEIMEDIKSYDSEKLNNYYSKNIEKWKEKDIQMYGK